MNKEFQNRLLASMDKVESYIHSAESFVIEQAPLVVQEMLFQPWIYFFQFLFYFLLLNGLSYFIVYPKANTTDNEATQFFGCVFIIVGGVFTTLGLVVTFERCLEVTFTPRLYILEQLASLAS